MSNRNVFMPPTHRLIDSCRQPVRPRLVDLAAECGFSSVHIVHRKLTHLVACGLLPERVLELTIQDFPAEYAPVHALDAEADQAGRPRLPSHKVASELGLPSNTVTGIRRRLMRYGLLLPYPVDEALRRHFATGGSAAAPSRLCRMLGVSTGTEVREALRRLYEADEISSEQAFLSARDARFSMSAEEQTQRKPFAPSGPLWGVTEVVRGVRYYITPEGSRTRLNPVS